MSQSTDVANLGELLKDSPKNWGKWGPDDEIGSLNYLQETEVLNGVRCIRSGRRFTLQLRMCDPNGDPMWPGRMKPQRWNVIDKGHFLSGKMPAAGRGPEGCDDVIVCQLQGSTQYDALGHVWYGDEMWNGYDPRTTIGGMTKASILPVAQRGIAGRGVLLDIARHRGKDSLSRGETFTHEDLIACAQRQGVELRQRDVIVIRTGWLESFYTDQEAFYGGGDGWLEPGLTYSPELVEWFKTMEIPNLVTDTMANEVTTDPVSGMALPLHIALLSYLGVLFTEMADLSELASDCAQDNQYEFLYTAAPLKVVQAAGSPVNPLVIK